MELILRGLAIYAALFVFMRIAGNRQFAHMTAFDFVLVIVIAEVTGQAAVGEDHSVTAAVILVATLVAIDIVVSLVKTRLRTVANVVDGIPTLLVHEGSVLDRNLRKERVSLADILSSARESRGIETLEDIKYAVLEPNGKISIVAWEHVKAS